MIADLDAAITAFWWNARRSDGAARRAWLASLYPAGVEMDWVPSVGIFRLPWVQDGNFHHWASPPVLKWVARARTGALVTFSRAARTGMQSLQSCPCCAVSDEDDAHAVSGCPGTGAGDCDAVVTSLWLQIGHACGVSVKPLSPQWVQAHLLHLAVALIPQSLHGFIPSLPGLAVSRLVREFHVALAERLASVLRRREILVAASATTSSAIAPMTLVTTSLTITSSSFCSSSSTVSSVVPLSFTSMGPEARHLTMAELKAVEDGSFVPASSLDQATYWSVRQAEIRSREETRRLPSWIKEHRFLKAVPVENGEVTAALLLLWEADHGVTLPGRAVEFVGRHTTFSARLGYAVEADNELSTWLERKKLRVSLTPGLPAQLMWRWGVAIDTAVGEPFLSSWKAYLASLVRHRQDVDVSALAPSGGRRRARLRRQPQPCPGGSGVGAKRARSSRPHHDPSKRACVDRLRAALNRSNTSSSGINSSSSSSATALLPMATPSFNASGVVLVRSGRATLGPPT